MNKRILADSTSSFYREFANPPATGIGGFYFENRPRHTPWGFAPDAKLPCQIIILPGTTLALLVISEKQVQVQA